MLGFKLIYVFDELPGRPVDPGFGVPHPGFPVDPGYGVPVPPGVPTHPIAPGGERPDHGLPPGVQLPIFIPPDGRPAHPIFPVLPSRPSRPTKPVPPDAPNQGLPDPSGEHPDQSLPEGEAAGGYILLWVPGRGYVAFPLPGGKVDNELPDTPVPEPQY
jgi:hypothetical protein